MKRSACRINYRDPESNSASIFNRMGEWTKVLSKIQSLFRCRENLLSLDSHGAELDRYWICGEQLRPVLSAAKRKRIPPAHSRHWPVRLVWGNAGWIRRGRHPQLCLAPFSTYSRVEIGDMDTGAGVEGCGSAGIAVGCRRDWHVYLSDPRALAILIGAYSAQDERFSS